LGRFRARRLVLRVLLDVDERLRDFAVPPAFERAVAPLLEVAASELREVVGGEGDWERRALVAEHLPKRLAGGVPPKHEIRAHHGVRAEVALERRLAVRLARLLVQ